MGGSKSKAKDAGQRTRGGVDDNLAAVGGGGGVGGHHLNPNQQSATPNRSAGPADGSAVRGTQPLANKVELALFGGVENSNAASPNNRCTLAGNGYTVAFDNMMFKLPNRETTLKKKTTVSKSWTY